MPEHVGRIAKGPRGGAVLLPPSLLVSEPGLKITWEVLSSSLVAWEVMTSVFGPLASAT